MTTQAVFKYGWRNILATGSNEKFLLSACNKQIAFRVELTNVASVEPAIAIDSFAGGSLVVVVTLKDMRTLNQDLAIVVYAQELLPGKVGTISGLFFGLAFGVAGIGAALLGELADHTSVEFVYRVCSLLPLLGLL